MKHIIAAAIFSTSFSANAELVCTEVTTPRGEIGQACKEVPPARPVMSGTPMPKPPAETRPPLSGTPMPKPPGNAPVSQPVSSAPGNTAAAQQEESVIVLQPSTTRADAFSGIAQAAALVPLMPSQGKTTLNLGAANFGGQSAIGLTIAHRVNGFVLSGGASVGTSGPGLVRVSAGLEF